MVHGIQRERERGEGELSTRSLQGVEIVDAMCTDAGGLYWSTQRNAGFVCTVVVLLHVCV